MMDMETAARIERIIRMERNLDEALEGIRRLPDGADIRRQIEELSAYYGSAEWFADLDADGAGELPAELKRGVLSQDAIYDLLMEYTELQRPADENEEL